MRNLLIVMVLVASLGGYSHAQTVNAKVDSKVAAEHPVMGLERERLRAYQTGDKVAFERVVAEGFTMTHSDGSIFTREQELEIIKPAPPDKPYPPLATENTELNVYGDTAILSGLLVEKESSAGRPRTVNLRFTNTYVKRRGRWQIVAGQLTRLPQTRTAMAVDAKTFDSYAGRYEVAPGRVFTVVKEADKLIEQIGNERIELVPEFMNQFFLKGSDAQVFFVRDANGVVTHLVSRRPNGEMIQAKRIN